MSSVSLGGGCSAAMYSGLQSARASQTSGVEKLFEKLDVNGDSSIDAGELESFADFVGDKTGAAMDSGSLLQSLDADGDGSISSTELGDNVQTLFSMLQEQLMGAKLDSRPEPPDPEQMFSKIDTDGDGSISADEFANAMQRGPGGPPPPSQGDDFGRMLVSLLEKYGAQEPTDSESVSTLNVAA